MKWRIIFRQLQVYVLDNFLKIEKKIPDFVFLQMEPIMTIAALTLTPWYIIGTINFIKTELKNTNKKRQAPSRGETFRMTVRNQSA